MKAVIRILFSVFMLLILSSISQAKEWRGLVPLHSTRKDVEKLLGPTPPPPNDGTRIYTPSEFRSIYFLDEGEVYIAYVREEWLERIKCSDLIPINTVISIRVTFKKKPELSEFQTDEKKFITFDPSEPPNIGFKAYVDDDQGIAICSQDRKVNDITYYTTAKDREICPAISSDPKQFCRILVDFIRRDESDSKTEKKQNGKKRP